MYTTNPPVSTTATNAAAATAHLTVLGFGSEPLFIRLQTLGVGTASGPRLVCRCCALWCGCPRHWGALLPGTEAWERSDRDPASRQGPAGGFERHRSGDITGLQVGSAREVVSVL